MRLSSRLSLSHPGAWRVPIGITAPRVIRLFSAGLVMLLAAGPVPADVVRVTWEGGSPPRWNEQTFASTNRVEAEVAVSAGHDFITAIVEDGQGRRVRNLLGQVPVGSLLSSTSSVERIVSVVWDGLNDEGQEVPGGIYFVRGVTIPRPRILFDYAFYNPNPLPWQGYSHSSWGADHTGPGDIACAPSNSTARTEVAVACAVAETPHAVLGLDGSRRKIWGYKREAGINGINAIAYADGALWMGFKDTVLKVDADTQRDIGWERPAGKAASVGMPGEVLRISVGTELGAALVRKASGADKSTKDVVVFFDKKSGTLRTRRAFPAEVELPWPAYDVVFMADGRLLASGDSGVFCVATNGLLTPVVLKGCMAPRRMAADGDGNLYVFDAGADWQVKVYGPDMALVRTVGRRGGQKVRPHGMFTEVEAKSPDGLAVDYGAFRTVGGMDVDRQGNLWVADPMHPRMVTVWNREGALVEKFVGNPEYGAAGCSMHEQDPALAYGYGLVFSIAPDRIVPHIPSRFVSSVCTNEPAAQRLPRMPQGHGFKSGRLFRSSVSGKTCEYFVHDDFGYPVLYVNRGGDYRPCAAAVVVAGNETPAQFAKPDVKPANPHVRWYGVWSDLNSDELVQPEEVFPLPEQGGRIINFYGMGYVFNPQLTWYLGGYAVAPSGFKDDGTPLYGAAGMQKLNDTHMALRTGKYLVGDSSDVFRTGLYWFADTNGNVFATYPLNAMGVHSSQKAPAPRTGETRGELCYAGAATVPGDLGPVVASQGNMGQMFVFTGDGLFVCALFKDTRYAPSPWPSEAGKGTDFTDCSMGQEPFDGCMVVQDDGKMRVVFGRTEANVCVVEGLREARRFGPVPVRFVPPDRAAGAEKAAGSEKEEASLAVRLVPAEGEGSIAVDGSFDDWRDTPVRKILAGDVELARVMVAYTESNLLLAVSVNDQTPMVNGFPDWRSGFRTGDGIDVYMGPAGNRPDTPVAGDVRMLLVPTKDGAAVVRYRPVVPGMDPDKRVPFTSPIGTSFIDEVKISRKLDIVFRKTGTGYVCEAALPFSLVGLSPAEHGTMAGDIGVLSSDGGGQQTMARNYIFNRVWTITSDLRSEAMLQPGTWGTLVFEKGPGQAPADPDAVREQSDIQE